MIDTDAAGLADMPRIAMDGSGNAIVAWSREGRTRTDVWTNRYVTGSGWTGAHMTELATGDSASHAEIALNASGQGVLAWTQFNPATNVGSVWARRIATVASDK